MDATVHVLYEVAGTIGAFTSVFLIDKFGYNYSFFLSCVIDLFSPSSNDDHLTIFSSSPVLFTLAGITWRFVDDGRILEASQSLEDFELERPPSVGYLASVGSGFRSFFKATYYGGFLVFSRESLPLSWHPFE